MDITGAIFDFDGTLFNSMHLWKGIRDKFFVKLGIEMTPEDKEVFKNVFIRESLQLANERFKLNMSPRELYESFFGYLTELYLEGATPKEGIIDFLKKLRAKNVKIGIATASGEMAIEAVLKKYGMAEYFDAIYSTHTVKSDKTASTVYDVTMQALGTEKHTTWIFEDAFYAAKTAKENGYKVVGIFDESEQNAQGLRDLCDIYIDSYTELEV